MTCEKRFNVLGETFEVLVTSNSTDNAFAVGAQICKPGGGPPPHIHAREDEYLIPLEGQFETFDGQKWTPLLPEGIFLPRNQVHTFRNSGTTMGRIMGLATPGGMDLYLEAISPLQLPRDMERLIAISQEYGITFCNIAAHA